MNAAKDEMLARIQLALADQPQPAPVERNYRTATSPTIDVGTDAAGANTVGTNPASTEAGTNASTTPPDLANTEARTTPSELIELLVDRLVDYRATVHRATPETAAEVITAVVHERAVKRLVVPEGFPAELLSGISADLVRDQPVLTAAELDLTDGVLTTSTVAIAETGTIVLDAGPGQGRRALTLVPDFHLCVVKSEDVVRGVPEAVALLGPGQRASARPLTWISGPSATSDIELQRVEGVHGPRTLAVLLITPNP